MAKITPQNYKQLRHTIPFNRMPKDLADTDGEMDMYLEFYGQDQEITEVVDLYLSKVNQIINRPARPKPKPTIKPARTIIKPKKSVCEQNEPEQPKEKSFTEKLKNPFVIGGAIAGLLIGKML